MHTKAISHTSVLKSHRILTYQLLLTEDKCHDWQHQIQEVRWGDILIITKYLEQQYYNYKFKDSDLIAQLKHIVSVIKTSQLMLNRGIVALCYEIHTKHKSTLREQNVEHLNDKITGTKLYYYASKI